MWFKNLSLLRLPLDYTPTVGFEFEQALSEHPLRSPGPLELETRGFVSPFSRADGTLTLVSSQNKTLFCLGTESRLLPSSVLRDAVAERIAEHELKTGRKPGKRLRNEMREAALGELLPRAFIKRACVGAYIDAAHRFLVVDTASDTAAEAVCTAVRDALGTFPARPLASEASLPLLMSEWLISGNLPAGFELGDQVKLQDPSDSASTVRGTHIDPTANEIREHARCGNQVTQLGLIFDGRISFVLDAKLKIRKLSFLDIVADKLDAQDGADPDTLLDAEFFLMSAELSRLFSALDGVLRFVD